MKSGNLNFLEPSGPLQACNRTALPFTYEVIHSIQIYLYVVGGGGSSGGGGGGGGDGDGSSSSNSSVRFE